MSGVGDWRQEKGSGNYGCYKLTTADDPEFLEVIANGGRQAQKDALEQEITMNNVGYRPNENDSRAFVQMVLDCGEDHDQWMRFMYLLLSRFTNAVERDLAFTEMHECGTHRRPCNYYNAKYTVKQFMDLINRILRQHPDAQTVQEISPNNKFHTNVV